MPSRRSFIESLGATCRNWTWSWAFIHEPKKLVIFGAWDINTSGGIAQLLDEKWERSANGRRSPAYAEARDYLERVLNGQYRLMTFPILFSAKRKDASGTGPSTIKGFEPELTECSLTKVGTRWLSSPMSNTATLPEEITVSGTYSEGTARTILVNAIERNPQARAACIAHYGPKCSVCRFDFGRVYPTVGEGYIHVHHLVPLASIGSEYKVDPVKDLRPVCPNCHAMLHTKNPPLKIEELRTLLRQRNDA